VVEQAKTIVERGKVVSVQDQLLKNKEIELAVVMIEQYFVHIEVILYSST
jgi:hypothetical protein